MKRIKKKVISCFVIVMMVIAQMPVTALHAQAAGFGVKICGVDIGISTTAKMKFTTSSGAASDSGYYYKGKYLGASQCFGFARWCQYKLFGKISLGNVDEAYKQNSKKGFYKISAGGIRDISAGSLNTTNLKKMIQAAKPGAHLRTHSTASKCAHSLVITKITDKGFSIAQCNGSNNNEYSGWKQNVVGTYTYTWASYVSSTYGARGIDYIEMPYSYPYDNKAPAAPSITAYTASKNTITISWNQVADAQAYRIDRRQANTDSYVTIKTLTSDKSSFQDGNLKPGTKYYYRVYASNQNGTSEKPAGYGAWTYPDKTTIKNVKAVGPKEIEITWNPQAGAASYTVMRRKSGDEQYVILDTVAETSYLDAVEYNAKYWYTVVCNNEAGQSGRSESVGGYAALTAPKGKKKDAHTVELSWNQYTANGSFRYAVYRNGEKIATVANTSYTDTKLAAATTYTYKLKVVDKTTGKALTQSLETDVTMAPDKPLFSIESVTTNTVKVKWTAVKGAVSYEIYRRKAGESYPAKPVATTNQLYFADTGLDAGQCYYYRVYAKDAKGQKSEKPDGIAAATKCEQSKCNHQFEGFEVTKNAACMVQGSKFRCCLKCGYKEVVSIPAIQHNYGLISFQGATAKEDGYELYRCEHCWDTYKVVLPATGTDTEKDIKDTTESVTTEEAGGEAVESTTTEETTEKAAEGVTTEETEEKENDNVTTEETAEKAAESVTTEETTGKTTEAAAAEEALGKPEERETTEETAGEQTEAVADEQTYEEVEVVTDDENEDEVSVGTVLTSSVAKCKVRVTKLGKEREVEYLKPIGKKSKVTIPKSVVIDEISYKVTAIAANALKNNGTVTSVVIGDNVKVIGARAFYKCKKLKEVVIGKGIESIGREAFYRCKKLSKITIKGKHLKTVKKKAFYKIAKKVILKVPKGKGIEYKKLLK